MKKFIIFISLTLCISSLPVFTSEIFQKEVCNLGWTHVKHTHSESAYQHAWCTANGGVEEVKNTDFTRVDCLTKTYAVEFDFANKWAESVGQALHYGLMTGKRPKVVLILENPQKQMVYYKRVENLSKKYDFDTEYITPQILNLQNGKCSYKDCKCKKTE